MDLHKTCFVCQSSELRPLPGYYEKHSLVKCRSCKLVFAHKIPSTNELNEHYKNYSYEGDATLSEMTRAAYLKLLDEFEKFRKTNRILDAGCGRGWFLEEAKKRGWEVYGTEFSDKAIGVCSAKGINMKHGALSPDMFAENFFDVITSFEVIEHINSPLADLKAIHSFLRKDGLLYCTTPNFNSVMRYYLKEKYNVIEYPEHLTYYTKRTLKHTIEKFPFKRIKFLSTGISITRIKQSLGQNQPTSAQSSDDNVREAISKKWYLDLAKRILNTIFTWTNTGLTLKAYYIKK